MNLFAFIFVLMICNAYGEQCSDCNCTTSSYFFICHCTSAKMCSEKVNNTVLLPSDNITIPSNIPIRRIKEIILLDVPVTLPFSQKLNALEKLTIKSCNISKIEKNTFQNIGKLVELIIANNTMQEVYEDTFDYVPNLKVIILEHNSIKKLPNKLLKNLTNLLHFNLAVNEIEKLNPNLFTDSKQIENIYLNRNNIKELPNIIFSGLTLVTEIDLGDNKIEQLPEGIFSNLNSLKNINLQNNRIISIHANAFADSSILENINLNGNKIQNIDPNILVILPELKYINMPASSIDCDCKMRTFYSSYKEREISGNINCSSSNNKLNKKFSDLTVEDFACAPRILNCFKEMTENITLIACKIYGDPEPKITWHLNDDDISENELFDLNEGRINEVTIWSNLTVPKISDTTTRLFKIKAYNNGGFNEFSYKLMHKKTEHEDMSERMEEQPSTAMGSTIITIVGLVLAFSVVIIIATLTYFKRKYDKSGVYSVQNYEYAHTNHGRNSMLLSQQTVPLTEKITASLEDNKSSTNNIYPNSIKDSIHNRNEEVPLNYYTEINILVQDDCTPDLGKHKDVESIPNIIDRRVNIVHRYSTVSSSDAEVSNRYSNYGFQSSSTNNLVNAIPKPPRIFRGSGYYSLNTSPPAYSTN